MSLIHISDEHNRLRKYLLYIFARYIEVPMLGIGYRLLRGDWRRIGRNPAFKALGNALFVRPMGRVGDAARPMHYQAALEYIDGLEGRIAVGDCRCRMAHKACEHPIETDIVIRTGTEAWLRAFPRDYRIIDKDEAKSIVTRCRELGMFHMVFVHCPVNRDNEYVICNCCVCGCVPYILNREMGPENFPMLEGEWVSATDLGRCTGRGDCVTVCPFDARVMADGKPRLQGCSGCGLCVNACPEGAVSMVRRKAR